MVAHPAVVSRLNWMMGPGWAESPASASVNRMGAGGQQMHGGPRYGGFEASNVSATSLGAMSLVPSVRLLAAVPAKATTDGRSNITAVVEALNSDLAVHLLLLINRTPECYPSKLPLGTARCRTWRRWLHYPARILQDASSYAKATHYLHRAPGSPTFAAEGWGYCFLSR